MAVPGSLPQRVHLLAYDPGKGRVRLGSNLGAMLRAAALADLYLSGHVADDRGRVVLTGHASCDDPVLRGVLGEIAGSRPRPWRSWVDRRQRATVRAVRQQLSDGGWVRLDTRRILGIFPSTSMTPRDSRVREDLLRLLDDALKNPIGRVESADAALVTIVATANLTHVLDRATRRDGKRRLQELTAFGGPIAPALRRSIQDSALGELAL